MTPTALDYLADYNDTVYPMEWLLRAADGATASSHPAIYAVADVNDKSDDHHGQRYGMRQQSWIHGPNDALAYDMNRRAGTSSYHKPRGSWNIKSLYALDAYGARRAPYYRSEYIYI